MNATITKKKAKTEKRPAIEQMLIKTTWHGGECVELTGNESEFPLYLEKGYEWFLVHTDNFKPYARKGSALYVHTGTQGCLGHKGLNLTYANGCFEILPVNKCKDTTHVIGVIREIRSWPNQDVRYL